MMTSSKLCTLHQEMQIVLKAVRYIIHLSKRCCIMWKQAKGTIRFTSSQSCEKRARTPTGM